MDSPADNSPPPPHQSLIIVFWWCALIGTTTFSLLPNMGPPTTPVFDIGLDKFIHLGTYLLLALIPALFFSQGKALAGSLVLVATLSIGIEFAQNMVPGRLFSLGDVVANMIGVIFGLGVGLYARRHGPGYFR